MPNSIGGGIIQGGGGIQGIPASSPATFFKQTLQYYLNLFTSQYKNSTTLQSWAQVLFGPLDDLTTAISGINTAFDLDGAIGVQLDALGVVLGVSRTLPFQPSNGLSPILDDTTYRLLLKATLVKNTWDGKLPALYAIWQYMFPGGSLIIYDNQNMTCTILIGGSFTSIENDLITNGYIVPRPEGVLYNYVFGTGPFLGFDLNNNTIAGLDTGHFT